MRSAAVREGLQSLQTLSGRAGLSLLSKKNEPATRASSPKELLEMNLQANSVGLNETSYGADSAAWAPLSAHRFGTLPAIIRIPTVSPINSLLTPAPPRPHPYTQAITAAARAGTATHTTSTAGVHVAHTMEEGKLVRAHQRCGVNRVCEQVLTPPQWRTRNCLYGAKHGDGGERPRRVE